MDITKGNNSKIELFISFSYFIHMNDKIKEIITEALNGYNIEKIILFGSRARGDYNEDSDYDVLVVIKEEIEWINREDIAALIRRKFAQMDIDVDILIRTSLYVDNTKDEIGNVISYAVEEGVEI